MGRNFTKEEVVESAKKGYSLISSSTTLENESFVGSFISEDESKIIVQIFNEGSEKI